MTCTPTAATSAPSATLPTLPSDSAEGAGAGAGAATAATKSTDRFGPAAGFWASTRSRADCVSCATRTPPAVSRHSISAVSENVTTDRASSGRDAKNARRSFFLFVSPSESSASPAAFFGTPGAGSPESPEEPRVVPGMSYASSSESESPSDASSTSSSGSFLASAPSSAVFARATTPPLRARKNGMALDAKVSGNASNGKLPKWNPDADAAAGAEEEGVEAGSALPSARASVCQPREEGLGNVDGSSSPVGTADPAPETTAAFSRGAVFRARSVRCLPRGAGAAGRFHRRPNAAPSGRAPARRR